MPDLWPAELGVSNITPPVSIMREQADLLTKKTQAKLEGRVVSSRDKQNFIHKFFILAPALDDYSYALFSITHPIDYYPLELFFYPLDQEKRCADEAEFINVVKGLLAHARTKVVISAILAQIDDNRPTQLPF